MADDSKTAAPASLEGRIDALSELTKCLLTAMVVHGSLTKEEALDLLDQARASLPNGQAAAGGEELARIAADLPSRLRAAAHPRITVDHHDH
ncbi:MAG TPA: hypothetical protein VNK52_11265 [Hyphomicrobiaceae bacterium]|nr:hypothetical protein [Hyphomicrobiaceae bacterium]